MKVIVYTRPGGGVSIVHPYYNSGLTIEQIAAKDVPAGIDYWIIDASELPSREYRDAWELNFGRDPDGQGAQL